VAWLDRQSADTLYLTATNLSEVLTGIELLPAGRRKSGLSEAMQELLERLFGARFLDFDREAAVAYAVLVSRGWPKAWRYPLRRPDCRHRRRAWIHCRHAGYRAVPRRRCASHQSMES